jgi:hypothetical protein
MFPSLVFCVFLIFQVLLGAWGFLGGGVFFRCRIW